MPVHKVAMFKNPKAFFSKHARKFMVLNLAAVLLFALLYKLTDEYEYAYGDVSKKGERTKDSLGNHLWFSLITQSTVGYGSPLYQNMPMFKKCINMLQLSSIFVIAGLLI